MSSASLGLNVGAWMLTFVLVGLVMYVDRGLRRNRRTGDMVDFSDDRIGGYLALALLANALVLPIYFYATRRRATGALAGLAWTVACAGFALLVTSSVAVGIGVRGASPELAADADLEDSALLDAPEPPLAISTATFARDFDAQFRPVEPVITRIYGPTEPIALVMVVRASEAAQLRIRLLEGDLEVQRATVSLAAPPDGQAMEYLVGFRSRNHRPLDPTKSHRVVIDRDGGELATFALTVADG